jgi:hypothetical protein
MIKIIKNILSMCFIIALFNIQLFAQQQNYLNRTYAKDQIPAVQNVFTQIENAISSGNVSALSRYFSQHTYFSLSNGVSGYFSTNQAY